MADEASEAEEVNAGTAVETKTVNAGTTAGTKTVNTETTAGTKTVNTETATGTKTVNAGAAAGTKTVNAGTTAGTKTVNTGTAARTKTVNAGAAAGTKTVNAGTAAGMKGVYTNNAMETAGTTGAAESIKASKLPSHNLGWSESTLTDWQNVERLNAGKRNGGNPSPMRKKRIVVKVGTSTLTHESGELNLRRMEHLVRALSDISGMGHELILVSSGAIAVGASRIGMPERPGELRLKQAAAAIGQCRMMHIYDSLFSEYNRFVAQILLTGDDVEEEERASHLSNTFSALLEMGVIPIVNENDSVSSAEIETGTHKVLGDNDTLSALVAKLCKADLLILLTDIEGLYDRDPREHPENARLIREIRVLTPEILNMASGAGSRRGTGGMLTKLSAAEISMAAGIEMVIAGSSRIDNLYDIIDGLPIGTRFIPS